MGKNPEHKRSSSSTHRLKNPSTKPVHANGKSKPLSNLKGSSKASKSKSKGKAIERLSSPASTPSEEGEEEIYEDTDGSEGGGVDKEGMTRLMQALGEDGLDEIGRLQLEALAAGSGSENGHKEGSDSEVEVEGSGDDEVLVVGQLSDESSDEGVREDELGAPEEAHEIVLDDVSSVDEDATPHQKIEIENKVALDQIRESMRLDPSLPWTETLALSYPHTIDVDVHDDLNREVAFYKQALHSAQEARRLALKHNLPFTRPPDFFAEMVKSDAHMERIRMRLLNESSSIKKSEDKRKEREGKKFGKQVQIEKIKELERSKKEMDEKLKVLKRKRKDILDKPRENDDQFDVAVEDAISDRPAKRGKASSGKSLPRSVRDKKYGFGGVGRRAKQNTKESTDNFDASKAGRGRGPSKGGFKGRHTTKRLGKSRRMAAKSKS